jgi:hypothetical protein
MVSFFICLPLLRYTLKHPEVVAQRMVTRLTGAEQPLPGPPAEIFISNLWRGLTMFAWDDGEVWVLSVIHRPALDLVSGALFYSGLVLLVIRYARQRHWFDLFTLISIPLLMMPSILSLAFPAENPSLNRPAGVIVPAFLVIGLMLGGAALCLTSLVMTWRVLARKMAVVIRARIDLPDEDLAT